MQAKPTSKIPCPSLAATVKLRLPRAIMQYDFFRTAFFIFTFTENEAAGNAFERVCVKEQQYKVICKAASENGAAF